MLIWKRIAAALIVDCSNLVNSCEGGREGRGWSGQSHYTQTPGPSSVSSSLIWRVTTYISINSEICTCPGDRNIHSDLAAMNPWVFHSWLHNCFAVFRWCFTSALRLFVWRPLRERGGHKTRINILGPVSSAARGRRDWDGKEFFDSKINRQETTS